MSAEQGFLLNFYLTHELSIVGVTLKESLSVGRELLNDVVLPDRTVSARHATFLLSTEGDEPVVLLRDEGSTNGSIVNGKRLRGATTAVSPQDRIRIGAFRVELVERVDTFEADITHELGPFV